MERGLTQGIALEGWNNLLNLRVLIGLSEVLNMDKGRSPGLPAGSNFLQVLLQSDLGVIEEASLS
ncbi:MAG TPA: hypothetical protein DCE41_34270 [Cytophagales bacterium]|nr:hypothetical protein [Cytophagales bacterium]HAA24112.1 hypothetical protein [Cytophagales bacterium]HAP58610.1 hypothetical protein [Cytophagales bacterium]